MEFCNVVDEEDVIVSGHDDKSVGVSGGDNMDMPADKKMLLCTPFSGDEGLGPRRCSSLSDPPDVNFCVGPVKIELCSGFNWGS
ncbi:disease resistance protein (TIR-NBS-LRR class), partial [Trifolium medium]|nr:disease resistance protein (TIR-NBS-LRR class) [Trifolium medium]